MPPTVERWSSPRCMRPATRRRCKLAEPRRAFAFPGRSPRGVVANACCERSAHIVARSASISRHAPHTFDEVRPWLTGNEGNMLYAATGCPECHLTGYASRTGVFEVMPISRPFAIWSPPAPSARELRDKAVDDRHAPIPPGHAAEGRPRPNHHRRSLPRDPQRASDFGRLSDVVHRLSPVTFKQFRARHLMCFVTKLHRCKGCAGQSSLIAHPTARVCATVGCLLASTASMASTNS